MENPKPQIPNPSRSFGKAKPFDLKERTLLSAVRIVRLAESLPETNEAKIIRRQIARAGTSIGANIEEADGAETRPDKRRSFTIARKETREVRYGLRVIRHPWGSGVRGDDDIAEATELLKINSIIVSKLG